LKGWPGCSALKHRQIPFQTFLYKPYFSQNNENVREKNIYNNIVTKS